MNNFDFCDQVQWTGPAGPCENDCIALSLAATEHLVETLMYGSPQQQGFAAGVLGDMLSHLRNPESL
jgi:hypothetical protein